MSLDARTGKLLWYHQQKKNDSIDHDIGAALAVGGDLEPNAAGTARGAALLAQWPPRNFQPPQLISAPPCAMEGLHAYRNTWTKAVLER